MGFLRLNFLQLEYNPGFHLWSLAALTQSPLHRKKMLRVASVCSGSGLPMSWWDLGSTRNMRCKASCISLWNFSIFSQLEYIPWKAQLTCPSISCMLIITSYLRNGNLHSFFSLIPIFSRKVLSSEGGCQEGTGHSFESSISLLRNNNNTNKLIFSDLFLLGLWPSCQRAQVMGLHFQLWVMQGVNDIPVHTPAQWPSFGAAESFLWWHLQAETSLAQVPVFTWAFLICSISWKEALLIVPLIQAETRALSKCVGEGYLIPHTSQAWEQMPSWSFAVFYAQNSEQAESRRSQRWGRLLRAPSPLRPAGGSVGSTKSPALLSSGKSRPAHLKGCEGDNAGEWDPSLPRVPSPLSRNPAGWRGQGDRHGSCFTCSKVAFSRPQTARDTNLRQFHSCSVETPRDMGIFPSVWRVCFQRHLLGWNSRSRVGGIQRPGDIRAGVVGSQEWLVRVWILWKARGEAMKQTAASGYSKEEGKEAVRKGIATGYGETALTDRQIGVNPCYNQSKQQTATENNL